MQKKLWYYVISYIRPSAFTYSRMSDSGGLSAYSQLMLLDFARCVIAKPGSGNNSLT